MIWHGICAVCEHYEYDIDQGRPACTAFPNGIPTQITPGGFDHRQPFDGDNGIRFEAMDGIRPEEIEGLLAAARPAWSQPEEPPAIA